MAEEPENTEATENQQAGESLEGTDNASVDALDPSSDQPSDGTIDATSPKGSAGNAAEPPKPKGLKAKLRRFNVYLLMFVFIVVIAGMVIAIAYFQSKKATTTSTLKTQDLTQATLEQVANSDATVGNSQQVLNVQSSAVFAGKVLVRQDLEVAGNIQIGGTVALTSLAVSGTSQLGQVNVSKDISVSGNAAIQGSATISKSLQVNGGGTFSGPISAPQITTSSLQLNSDLILTRHIVVGGGRPSRSSGGALGGGGSASVSGSDTAGNVSINTGSGPPAGCFVTVNFTRRFNSTPRVVVTPIGSAAGGLAWYVSRDSSGFSICDASTPPSGSHFSFDYFVVD